MSNLISEGLIKDKLNLESGYVTKSSAIFPIFNLSQSDLILSFQNYWEWKKGIKVKYIIRIRNTNGELILKTEEKAPLKVNSISIKQLLKDSNLLLEKCSEGTAEIEINSLENLVFPFPAILGIYKSVNEMISMVHSAGRSLEKSFDEEKDFSETNFFVSDNKRYKPFIHLFNGSEGSLKNIKIRIESTITNKSKEIYLPDIKLPYESKVIFLDNHLFSELTNFDKNDEKKRNNLTKFIVKVSGKTKSVFSRFICGNFDTVNQHYCVTHTYREINNNKDILKNINSDRKSLAVLPIAKDFFKLNLSIYPTTSSETNSIIISSIAIDDLETIETSEKRDLSINSTSIFSRLFDKKEIPGLLVSAEPSFEVEDLPARIPINLMYELSDHMNTLPTDIAFQMTTYLSKARKNHWHNGIITKGYSYIISGSGLISESLNNFEECSALEFGFYLSVNDTDDYFYKVFSLSKNEAKLFTIELNQIFIEAGFKLERIHSYSWRIEVVKGNLTPLICLSYNRKLGCIYGEHSF